MKRPEIIKKGQPITAEFLRDILNTLIQSSKLSAAAPLSVVDMAGGKHIVWSDDIKKPKVAKTNEVITKMEGDTPGVGGISLYDFDGTNLVDSDIDSSAFNEADSTIDSDKWIQVKPVDGEYFIDFERCGDST